MGSRITEIKTLGVSEIGTIGSEIKTQRMQVDEAYNRIATVRDQVTEKVRAELRSLTVIEELFAVAPETTAREMDRWCRDLSTRYAPRARDHWDVER